MSEMAAASSAKAVALAAQQLPRVRVPCRASARRRARRVRAAARPSKRIENRGAPCGAKPKQALAAVSTT